MVKLATTPEIEALLAINSPVAIGISGGKDSSAVAAATIEYLNERQHGGPRVLIHSDLGVTEWAQSLEICQDLAERLQTPFIVVRRAKGDMMDRWEQRWADNLDRYRQLECVKLILPWSTASMRFCTSEMKVAPICQELTRLFPGQTILNVTGIRRQESNDRKNAPIAKPQPKLTRVRLKTTGWDWHPIADWSLQDVLIYLALRQIPLHEAYTKYHLSRVSCAFCILQNAADQLAATTCEANHPLYRRMVDLEIASTFAFQDNNWLGDVAPHLLSPMRTSAVGRAKFRSQWREKVEAKIPQHLLYTKGWPTVIPTLREARLLCDVRGEVATIVDSGVEYATPKALLGRYRELYEANHDRND